MPRRNRKGRRPGQRPRRYHSNRESRRERRELVVLDDQPAPALARECGNCLEWLPPRADAIGARGTCSHPASGVLAPDADTPACDWFQPRRPSR
ncbi:MAG: hypothetical protein OXH13_01460 [Chloroflexi bacterium]|nr:hypothetical protein [Chloroflexota bacterium]MCY3697301.1 hypothetical protein [Chloroflexota bacterium]